jgi:hypothetical protein
VEYQWGDVGGKSTTQGLDYHHHSNGSSRWRLQGCSFDLSTGDTCGRARTWIQRRLRGGQLRDGVIVPAPGEGTKNYVNPQLKGAEKPVGQWNTLDLICLDNTALHVLNGKVVAVVADIRIGPDAQDAPVTSGAIGFHAGKGELFIRRIEIRPIGAIPAEFLK